MAPASITMKEVKVEIDYFTGFYNNSKDFADKLSSGSVHCLAVFRLEDCLLRLYNADSTAADSTAADRTADSKETLEVFDLGVAEMIIKPLPEKMALSKGSKNNRDYMRIVTITNIPGQGSRNIILLFPTGKSCKDWVHRVVRAQAMVGLDDINRTGPDRRVSVDSHYCQELIDMAEDMGTDALQAIKLKIDGLKDELTERTDEYDAIRNDLSNQTSQCETRSEQIKLKENDIQHIKQQILISQPQKKYKYIIPNGQLSHENDQLYHGSRRGTISVDTCQLVARKRAESRLHDWMRFDTEREVELRPGQLIEIARLENKKREALTVDNGRTSHSKTISPAQQKMLKNTKLETPNLPSSYTPPPDDNKNILNAQYELATHTVKVSRTGSVSDVTAMWGPDKPSVMKDLVSFSAAEVYGQDTVDTLATHLDRLQSREAFREQSDPNEMLQLLRLFEEPLECDLRNEGKPKGAYKWGNVDNTLLGACILSIAEQAQKVLINEPRLLRISSPTYTFGDFRGNFHDLVAFERLFWRLGPKCMPSNFLFLGNYVDGGDNGLEVVAYLLSQKLIAPHSFFLIRGHHEMRNVQELSTFKKECMSKLGQVMGQKVWKAINKCFDVMPLAAVIDNKIFCAHGGFPAPYHKGGYLSEFDRIPHELADPMKTSPLAVQVMLSEPLADREMELVAEKKKALVESGGFLLNNTRGEGAYFFSKRALELFLKRNGLSHMIRSDQVKDAGFQIQQNSRLLTVFSSSGYKDGTNQAACVLVDGNKLRVFRVDKNSLVKGPLIIDNIDTAQTLHPMPNDTELDTIMETNKSSHDSSYELAMHTVNVQRTGSLKDMAVLYGSDHFYNPDLMSLSAAQVCRKKEEAQKKQRSKSIEAFNDQSSPHEMLHLLRFFEQPLDADPNDAGKPKEAYSWGSVDPTHLSVCIMKLCQEVYKLLYREPRLVHLPSPSYILGDLHGNYQDLVSFEKLLWPMGPALAPSKFLFLGDYVDRGDFGVEVVAYLFAQKLIAPHKFILLRGNHEDRFVQAYFSFRKECRAKFGDVLGRKIWGAINKCFDVMPLAAVIDKKLFCVHGGIPSPHHEGGFLREFKSIPRDLPKPGKTCRFAYEVMWNDPLEGEENLTEEDLAQINEEKDGFTDNPGRGPEIRCFTTWALDQFLERNKLSHVIRAHQVKMAGCQVQKAGKLLTVFSSSNYREVGNQAACILADRNKIRSIRIDLASLDQGVLEN